MNLTISDALSDEATLAELGRRMAAWRIAQHLTQAQLGDLAGVSRSTIRRLEAGEGGELRNFIRVLRSLGKSPGLDALLPAIGPSPLDALKLAGRKRKRVRSSGKPGGTAPAGPWKWGDER